MSLDEDALETVAKDGSMDYAKWPGLVDPLLERLDYIVHHRFPLPTFTQNSYETVPTVPQASPPQSHDLNSQANSNKENAPPPSQLQTPPRPPPVPLFQSPSSSERIPDSQPQPAGPSDDALPAPLLAMLSAIKSTLKTDFPSRPPHTVQRLAELILRPNSHYRTLPAYLRALDRVVTVSSSADIFPLPRTAPLPGTNIDGEAPDGVNGVGNTNLMFNDSTLGSDESLGGALLTPIPWLNNTSMSEEHTAFGEQPDASAAVQGEHAHPHPEQEDESGHSVTNSTMNHQAQQQPMVGGARGQSPDPEDSDSVPHPRGPPVLGVEDLGLQNGRGVEMTLDTANTSSTPHAADPSGDTHDQQASSELDADADGDVVISDALEDREAQDRVETKVGEAEVLQSEGG